MKCKVEQVYKNMRYKVLRLNGNLYILDMDRSFWGFLFPFVYWFMHHKAYKIDKETYKLIQMPKSEQMSTGSIALLGGGISILFVNLLKPLLSELNLHIVLGIKILFLIIIIILSIFIRLYIHNRLFKNLNRTVDFETLHPIYLKIKPERPKYCLIYFLGYLFIWGFTFIGCGIFWIEGNMIILMLTPLIIIWGLIWNSTVIPVGTAEVTILDK